MSKPTLMRREFMRKKIISLLLTLILITASFAGCSVSDLQIDDGKLSVVAATFPEYDWVKNILGDSSDDVNLTMLLKSGVDLHNFQPSAADIVRILSCDVFIFTGGESDKWVSETLSASTNKDMVVIDLLNVLGSSAKEEEIVEGMQEENGEDEEVEYDEHVWLSLNNAKTFCSYISDRLGEINHDKKEIYKHNTKIYIEKLSSLDEKYREELDSAKYDTLIFADRFPFRYLTDDYDIKYYAAFAGCSAETEASFETVKFLADKLNLLNLPAVMTIEQSDCKIAKTVVDASGRSNVEILSLDSMQAITAADIERGVTYLSIMEKNLDELNKALN